MKMKMNMKSKSKSKSKGESEKIYLGPGYDVPPEVEEQILLKLPVKSLVRFRSVCRYWNSLVTDTKFINDHLQLQKTKSPSSFLLMWAPQDQFTVLNVLGNDADVNKKQVLSRITTSDSYIRRDDIHLPLRPMLKDGFGVLVPLLGQHCNGIICLVDTSPYFSNQVVFYNPALREHILVQTMSSNIGPCRFYSGYGLGHDSITDNYKFIRLLHYTSTPGLLNAEVYTLGTGEWKEIKLTTEWYVYGSGTYLEGRLYWQNHGEENVLVWYDLSDDSFGSIDLPEPHDKWTNLKPILVWNGSLVIFSFIKGSMDMYVMGGSAGGLSKFYSFGAMPDVKKPIAFWRENELLMAGRDGYLRTYNFGDRQLTKVPVPVSAIPKSLYGTLYAETLVSVKTRALPNL